MRQLVPQFSRSPEMGSRTCIPSYPLFVLVLAFGLIGMAGTGVSAEESESHCPSGEVRVMDGFLTGNHYKALTPFQQRMHVAGYVNGLLMGRAIGVRDACMDEYEECFSQLSLTRMVTSLRLLMATNPDRMNEPMNFLMWSMVRGLCFGENRAV